MKAIEIRHIMKSFDDCHLLEDVQLALDEGEAYGLTGANGSGKSLLLRMIAALERPDCGTISVLGHDTVLSGGAVRRCLGFLSDRQAALRGLTVVEQLALIAECRGLRRGERLAAVDDMLELVDLAQFRDRQVTRLSRGQARRLALATSMIHDPAVLLCDEPLEGLDADGYLEMHEVLGELRTMGKTIVIASNNADDIARLCHKVGVLERGNLTTHSVIEYLNTRQHQDGEQSQAEWAA